MTLLPVSLLDLTLAALLVIAVALLTRPASRQSARGLLVAMLRMGLQLALLGLILEAVFASVALWSVALVSLVMLLAAGHEVVARQSWRGGRLADWRLGLMSLVSGAFLLTLLALLVLLQVEPWYHPRYAIPLLGMLLGNTMTGIALAVSRVREGAFQQAGLIEARLALGQTWRQASTTLYRDGIRQGLIPVINMMAATGLVSLPGMMTGQLLAGADPATAVRYQMLIILLIAAGAGFGVMLATRLTVRGLFDQRQRLRLDGFKAAD
jgi:putative ABC transport system permease protein